MKKFFFSFIFIFSLHGYSDNQVHSVYEYQTSAIELLEYYKINVWNVADLKQVKYFDSPHYIEPTKYSALIEYVLNNEVYYKRCTFTFSDTLSTLTATGVDDCVNIKFTN